MTKTAPIDATPVDSAAVRDPAAAAPRAEGDPLTAARPSVDRVDIKPLDMPAAMQILIAEIRTALDLPAGAAEPAGWTGTMPGAGTAVQDPMQTARLSIQLLLDALPEQGADPAADAAAVAGVELKFQSAMDRALDVFAQWPDVPRVVVDAAVEARMHVTTQMAENPTPNAPWPRPEWLGMAPGIQSFRRRRRRRTLTDPDFGPVRDDEPERPVDTGDRPREEPR